MRFGDINPETDAEFFERILTVRKFGAETRISAEVWERANLKIRGDIFGDILARLELQIFTEQHRAGTATESIEFPTTFWQMWKRDHAPLWFARKFPIKTKRHTLQVSISEYKIYPQAQFSLPKRFGEPVIFRAVNTSWLPEPSSQNKTA